jgi:hypothetical protein
MVEGERILGRFTVGERLGKGGYGTVHRAWDERLCRHVAVKAVEGEAAGRVMREAHAAARLNHPGIVTLYELGTEHGTTYLVSELVQGPNLREFAATGELADRDVAEIGAEVCRALAHAHSQGVVHRDLKPDNVLIRRRGGRLRPTEAQAMLADFGIAAVADEPSLTVTGQVVGTLAYMSPEQAAGEVAGPASDVYSLALTLYELWAGTNPVAGPTPAATAKRIGTALPPLGEARPELPEALTALLDDALEADPELRPTVPELQVALLDLAGSLHPDRSVPEPESDRHETPLPEGLPARPFAVLLAAGAIAALGLLAGYPGIAIAIAALFAPAALLLSHPREWLLPALAPILGIAGLAPLFLLVAARHPRPLARAALAGLAWAWTVAFTAVLSRGLGVVDPEPAGAWTSSGRDAVDALIQPMSGADALATGLIWVGAAILLGFVLDLAGSAMVLVLGLVWSAALVAALGAVGGPAAPGALLAFALMAGIGWIAWDRAGRPALPRPAARDRARPKRPQPAARPAQPRLQAVPGGAVSQAVQPRDERARATRAASRHVQAALHGAGSRAGLP